MEERRKKNLALPFLATFQFIFVIVIVSLILSVAVLYYSFKKKIERPQRTKPVKVNKFLEVPHSYSAQLMGDGPLRLSEEKTYYSIVSKILSFGSEFKTKCYEMAVDARNISFFEKDTTKFHTGIFKANNLSIISQTTHLFDIPLKEQGKKVYHQLIGIDDNTHRPYVVHFFEVPKFKIEEWKSSINFCGVFYRVIRYENKNGKEVKAPLFLTYTVEKFSPPPRNTSPFTSIAVLLVTGIILLLFFLRHKSKVKRLEVELKKHYRNT
ncbi:MAG: hypothetical protein ACK4NF_07330 [Planctomycetota bacterium]